MHWFAGAAVVSAGISGLCLGTVLIRNHQIAVHRRHSRERIFQGFEKSSRGTIDDSIFRYAVKVSRQPILSIAEKPLGQACCAKANKWLDLHAVKAGIKDDLSPEGFVETSIRLAGYFLLAGTLLGALLSQELAILVGCMGAVSGALALPKAIKRAERKRAEMLGSSLSEMLEVVALGLRSGLSFDRSFQLYGEHFDTPFAHECTSAQRSWLFGLSTREEALRNLAESYDSPILVRVTENIIHSLYFGSSLVETLETASTQVRTDHRSHIEERVAKAPVKMMVPTAVLILPAMLLLVLGPVLLELMERF